MKYLTEEDEECVVMDIEGNQWWQTSQAVMKPGNKEAIIAVNAVCNEQGNLQITLEALSEKVNAKTYLEILRANQFLTVQIR